MWRHEDFWRVLGGGIDFYTGEPLEEYDQSKQANDPRMVTFPLSPLMHGGAQAGLLMHLFAGHLTILEPKFDAQRTWEIIEREGVQLIFMTGDAMARPLIEEFERKAATGTPYDGSSLFAVSSSAAIFSASVKERWMAAFPNTVFTDSVGASETGFQGMGLQDKDHISTDGPVVGLGPTAWSSTTTTTCSTSRPTSAPSAASAAAGRCRSATTRTRRSRPRRSWRSTASATPCPATSPGSSPTTRSRCSAVARTASTPAGRRSTPKRSRWRSRRHPGVYDVLVVGVPDEKFGQSVTAVIQPREGAEVDLDDLRTFLRASLSGYKLPRAMTLVDEIPRNATGKAQYPKAKELALASFAAKVATSPTGA